MQFFLCVCAINIFSTTIAIVDHHHHHLICIIVVVDLAVGLVEVVTAKGNGGVGQAIAVEAGAGGSLAARPVASHVVHNNVRIDTKYLLIVGGC